MANNKKIEREALIKDIGVTIFTRRLTIVGFIIMIAFLQFAVPTEMSDFLWWAVELLLILWFITTFFFKSIIKQLKTVLGINNVHFGYFTLELLIMTSIVHFTGGVEGIGILFYIFIILYAGIFLSRKRGVIIAFVAAFFYSTFIILEYFGAIPHRPLSPTSFQESNSVISYTIIAAITFLFVTYTAGIFAAKLRERTKKLFEAYGGLEEKTKELNESKEELEESKISLEIKVKARTKELEELAQSLEGRVEERTKEIQEKVKELEKFNKLAVGRELKMTELKKELKRLKEK